MELKEKMNAAMAKAMEQFTTVANMGRASAVDAGRGVSAEIVAKTKRAGDVFLSLSLSLSGVSRWRVFFVRNVVESEKSQHGLMRGGGQNYSVPPLYPSSRVSRFWTRAGDAREVAEGT